MDMIMMSVRDRMIHELNITHMNGRTRIIGAIIKREYEGRYGKQPLYDEKKKRYVYSISDYELFIDAMIKGHLNIGLTSPINFIDDDEKVFLP